MKYKIIGQRHLRKYTAPRTTPVYSARIDVQAIADTLCDVPWSKVTPKFAQMSYHTNEPVGDDKTSGFDKNVTIRDNFDAALFCAGHTNGLHRAYANAAAYVYNLPEDAVGKSLTSISLEVTSDPYNTNGARIHIMTSQTGEPPINCRICRGEDETGNVISDGTTATGVAKRTVETINGTEYWYPTNEKCTLTPSGGLTLQKYLIVLVLMENYATTRGDWIEGCSFINNLVEMEVDGEIAGWIDGGTYDLTITAAKREFNVCREGILPCLTSTKTGIKTITLQKNGDELIGSTFLKNDANTSNALCKFDETLASIIANLDGPVTSIDVMQPQGLQFNHNSTTYRTAFHFAVITGAFSRGSFTGLSGFLIYDVFNGRLFENISLEGFDTALIDAARNGHLRGGFVYATSASLTSTSIKVFANFETGAFVYNSQVYPFASFDIDRTSGAISNPFCINGVEYDPDVNCHFTVQSGADTTLLYTYAEHLYLDNGKILPANGTFYTHFPSTGVAYEGTITAIRPLKANNINEFRFLVSGDLTSIGGVACKNCAIITTTTAGATITVPPFDNLITPDTYESFSVSASLSCLTAVRNSITTSENGNSETSTIDIGYEWHWGVDNTYIVSGAFNALSGNNTLRKAVDIINNQITQKSALSEVSKIIGAVSVYDGPMIYAQGSRESTALDIFDATNLHPDISAVQSVIGLRTLYAKLYNRKLYEVSQIAVGSKARVGAGFVVKSDTVSVKTFNGTTYVTLQIPVWQMTLSSLVVPFSLPQDFTAVGIRLDWPKLSATGGKLNIWLQCDSYIDDPDTGDPSFYLADKNMVNGWKFIGQINSDDTSAFFTIDTFSGRCASLLFTAYISLDDLNPSDEMIATQGVATSMDVNSITSEVAGLDTTWKPDITLIG